MKNQKVSNNVIRRLPRYIRHLDTLAEKGVTRVSSSELGSQMGLTASQVRQDFNCFGGLASRVMGILLKTLEISLHLF